jgi:hypothetical protein
VLGREKRDAGRNMAGKHLARRSTGKPRIRVQDVGKQILEMGGECNRPWFVSGISNVER